jgi:hypothetical protein
MSDSNVACLMRGRKGVNTSVGAKDNAEHTSCERYGRAHLLPPPAKKAKPLEKSLACFPMLWDQEHTACQQLCRSFPQPTSIPHRKNHSARLTHRKNHSASLTRRCTPAPEPRQIGGLWLLGGFILHKSTCISPRHHHSSMPFDYRAPPPRATTPMRA